MSSGQGVITTLSWWSRLLEPGPNRTSKEWSECARSDRFCDSGMSIIASPTKRAGAALDRLFQDPGGNGFGTPRF